MAGTIVLDAVLDTCATDRGTVDKTEKKEKEKGFVWKYRK
jgi:hypothetical protein